MRLVVGWGEGMYVCFIYIPFLFRVVNDIDRKLLPVIQMRIYSHEMVDVTSVDAVNEVVDYRFRTQCEAPLESCRPS